MNLVDTSYPQSIAIIDHTQGGDVISVCFFYFYVFFIQLLWHALRRKKRGCLNTSLTYNTHPIILVPYYHLI